MLTFDSLQSVAYFFMRPFRVELAKCAAKRWIKANLKKSFERCQLQATGIKAEFEHDTHKHLTTTEFAEVLKETGRMVGGIVYAKLKSREPRW